MKYQNQSLHGRELQAQEDQTRLHQVLLVRPQVQVHLMTHPEEILQVLRVRLHHQIPIMKVEKLRRKQKNSKNFVVTSI